jgi:hypothetical protein
MKNDLKNNLLLLGQTKLIEMIEDLERKKNNDVACVAAYSKKNFCEDPVVRQQVIDYLEKELGKKVLFAKEDGLNSAEDILGTYVLYEDVPEDIEPGTSEYLAWMTKTIRGDGND